MSSTSSTTEPSRPLPQRVSVGFVRRPHGVRGTIVVAAESDNPERFAPGSELIAVVPGGAEQTLTVVEAKPHGPGCLALRCAGIESREQAEALRGAGLEVDRRLVPPAPDGTYYYFELIGCRCRDRVEGELGQVVDVVEDGGGLLLIVESEGRVVPIPFVARFVARIDVAAGQIELDLPAGLVESCASTS